MSIVPPKQIESALEPSDYEKMLNELPPDEYRDLMLGTWHPPTIESALARIAALEAQVAALTRRLDELSRDHK